MEAHNTNCTILGDEEYILFLQRKCINLATSLAVKLYVYEHKEESPVDLSLFPDYLFIYLFKFEKQQKLKNLPSLPLTWVPEKTRIGTLECTWFSEQNQLVACDSARSSWSLVIIFFPISLSLFRVNRHKVISVQGHAYKNPG